MSTSGSASTAGLEPLPFAEREVLAFGRLHALEIVQQRHRSSSRTQGRRRGLSIGARRRRDGRTGDQLLEIALPLGNAGHTHSQTPRRAESLGRRVDPEPLRLELLRRHLRQLPRERRQPARGELFEAEFDQEFAIHGDACRLQAAGCWLQAQSGLRPDTACRL